MLLVVVLRAPKGIVGLLSAAATAGQCDERRAALALEVNDIARNFGGLVALRDVSFDVREGEVMGLIGPNGAGKSTLFEIISGNLPPSGGTRHLFRRRLHDDAGAPAPTRRHVPHVPEGAAVREHDGRENIRVAASQCAAAGAQRAQDEVAADPGAAAARGAGRPAARPSSRLADRKRVEIGRAIAGHCRLLMLDESMSGLTHDEAEHLITEILALNRDARHHGDRRRARAVGAGGDGEAARRAAQRDGDRRRHADAGRATIRS